MKSSKHFKSYNKNLKKQKPITKKKDVLLKMLNDNAISCICNDAYDLLYTDKYKIDQKQQEKIRKYVQKNFKRKNLINICNQSNPLFKRKKALLQEGGNFVDWLKNTVDKVNVFLQKAVIGDY